MHNFQQLCICCKTFSFLPHSSNYASSSYALKTRQLYLHWLHLSEPLTTSNHSIFSRQGACVCPRVLEVLSAWIQNTLNDLNSLKQRLVLPTIQDSHSPTKGAQKQNCSWWLQQQVCVSSWGQTISQASLNMRKPTWCYTFHVHKESNRVRTQCSKGTVLLASLGVMLLSKTQKDTSARDL